MNTPPKNYDYHDTCEEHGIAVVGKDGKFGYINRNGKEITPLKYDRAMRFYWNIGKVQLNGKWGFVNKQGKEIVPPIYDEIKGHKDPIVRLGDKYGFISLKTGKLLTPVKYDKVEEWSQFVNILISNWDKKDLAPVQLDGKWGCINLKGKEIVPAIYDELCINQFENPRVAAKLNEKWGFIRENGKAITLFEFDEVWKFDNARACVKKEDKFGFINTKGKVVIPVIYDDCENGFHIYKDKPICVAIENKYGFVNIAGKEIIKPKYELANSFCFGMASVVLNNKVGFIDKKGRMVIPCQYEPDFRDRDNYQFIDGYANVKSNGKWGVIDTKNNPHVPFLYNKFLKNRGIGFRYALRDGKKWSVDFTGKEWEVKKNHNARTFKEYLNVEIWENVAESFKKLICNDKEEMDADLKIYETNFNNFKSKKFRPSKNFIRIHSYYDNWYSDFPSFFANLISVKDKCTYGILDWEEILDMEVRVEENLIFTDADIVAICIWIACDRMSTTESSIKAFQERLDEKGKTIDENFCVV